MAQYIGNLTKHVDFKKLIDELPNGFIDQLYIYQTEITPEDEVGYKSQMLLRNAGYPDLAWDGVTYSPVVHFNKNVIETLDNVFGAKCTACWISELYPGRIAPPHWDIDRRTDELKQYGNIVRYGICIGDYDQGHAFFVENQCLYNQESGSTYKWDIHDSLHSGSNAGTIPKYMMIYAGLELHEGVSAEYQWGNKKFGDPSDHRDKFLNLKFETRGVNP